MSWDGKRGALSASRWGKGKEQEQEAIFDPTLMSSTWLMADANAGSPLAVREYRSVMSLGMTLLTTLMFSLKAFYGTEDVTSYEQTSTTSGHLKVR